MAVHSEGVDVSSYTYRVMWLHLSVFGETITAGLVAQGVIIGVVSSTVFLTISYMVRPRLFICKHIIDACEDGVSQYRFKVINFGLWSTIDVNLELEMITTEVMDGNESITITPLQLSRNQLTRIPPFRPHLLDRSRSYAVRFRTFESLDVKWTDRKQHLRLYVKARHPITGFTRLTHRNFYFTKQKPKKGDFEQGWRTGMIFESHTP